MTIKSVLPLLNFSGKKSTVKQMTMIIKFIITRILTRKNCFRYLKLMSPLNVAICTTISYTLWVEWYYLKNNYLTLKVKGEGHYGTWHTTLWSCTHIPNIIDLSRKTKMLWPGQENTILKKKIDLEVKGQGPMKIITVCDTPPYGHAPTYQISLTYQTKML